MHAANDNFRYLFLYGWKVQMLQSCAVGPCPPGVDESARILQRCISALERLEATTLSNPSLHGSVRPPYATVEQRPQDFVEWAAVFQFSKLQPIQYWPEVTQHVVILGKITLMQQLESRTEPIFLICKFAMNRRVNRLHVI